VLVELVGVECSVRKSSKGHYELFVLNDDQTPCGKVRRKAQRG
jgi:hypothetical protein